MTAPTILLIAVAIIAGSGCGQRSLHRRQESIKKGMTQEEVLGVLGTGGYLQKSKGAYGCPKGHSWAAESAEKGDVKLGICPVCEVKGSPRPESWCYFVRRPLMMGAPFIGIDFDGSGKVKYCYMGDM